MIVGSSFDGNEEVKDDEKEACASIYHHLSNTRYAVEIICAQNRS